MHVHIDVQDYCIYSVNTVPTASVFLYALAVPILKEHLKIFFKSKTAATARVCIMSPIQTKYLLQFRISDHCSVRVWCVLFHTHKSHLVNSRT